MIRDTGNAGDEPRIPHPRCPKSNCARPRPMSRPRRAWSTGSSGWAGTLVTSVAVAMSLFHLYAASRRLALQQLRHRRHAAAALHPRRLRADAELPAVPAGAPLPQPHSLVGHRRRHRRRRHSGLRHRGGEDFTDRATLPTRLDVVLGVIFIVLLLEATRRTTGWIVPFVALLFIAYALAGPYLPPPWTHRGYDLGATGRPPVHHARRHFRHSGRRVVVTDHPVHHLRRVPAAFRRRQVLHRFLDGADGPQAEQRRPHRGAVVVPARRSVGLGRGDHGDDRRRRLSDDAAVGLRANAAGGLLAAGGLGAIISPPVLGAAAFLIAEFLKISYLDVIWMATIPTCLYYLSLLFMVELDAKRFGAHDGELRAGDVAVADDPALRLPFHLADLHHRVHAVGLLADAVGVLVDRADLRAELSHAARPRSGRRSSCAPCRTARPACSPRPPPARPPGSSSAS